MIERRPGVYLITCTVNGKRYIGSSKNVKQRIWSHQSLLKREKHPNPHLQNSYNTHGREAFTFEVLVYSDDLTRLVELEQYYIDTLLPEYNIRPIAESNLGMKMPEESVEAMKKRMKGRVVSAETRIAIAASRTGTTFPEEWRQNIKKSKQNISDETKELQSESAKARVARDGMSKATMAAAKVNKGKPRSEETKRKIAETKRKKFENGEYTHHSNYQRNEDGTYKKQQES